MTVIDKILNGKLSYDDLLVSLNHLINKFNDITNKITEKNGIYMSALTGETLNKIFTNNIDGVIKQTSGNLTGKEFNILNPNISINTSNIVVDNSDDKYVTHKKITDFLNNNYSSLEKVLSDVVDKNNYESNFISVKEALLNSDSIDRSKSKLSVSSGKVAHVKIDDYTILNSKTVKDNYFTKTEKYNVLSTIMPSLKDVFLSNANIDELVLDYTLSEISGAGSKLSPFVIDQASAKPVDSVWEVNYRFFEVGSDNKTSLKVNETTVESEADNDSTIDTVVKDLGDKLTGFTTSEAKGLWTGISQNADGDTVFGWVIDSEEEFKDGDGNAVTPTVSITEDNDSDHDLTLEYDDENKFLTVTYASDGGDTVFPSIDEFVDDVNDPSDDMYVDGSDKPHPFKVKLINTAYSGDDDCDIEDDYELSRANSKLTISLDTADITTVEPTPAEDAVATKKSTYVEGKHLKSHFKVDTFRRGYKYWIKLDGTEYDVDTTDDNNPDVTTKLELVQAFKDQIPDDLADTTVNPDTLNFTYKGYDNHTEETSGESDDYIEPLPRTAKVKEDIKEYAFQKSDDNILKKSPNGLNEKYSPLSYTNVDKILSKGYIYTNKAISDVRLSANDSSSSIKKRAVNDFEVATTLDIKDVIDEYYMANPHIFLEKPLMYATINTLAMADCNFHAITQRKLLKDGIFVMYKNEFVPLQQNHYTAQQSIDTLQTALLGMEEAYYSTELNTVSSYLLGKNTYQEILETPNAITANTRKGVFNLKTDSIYIKDFFKPIYGQFDYKLNNSYVDDILNQPFMLERLGVGRNSDKKLKQKAIISYLLENPEKLKDVKIDGDSNFRYVYLDLALHQNGPLLLDQVANIIAKFFFTEDDIAMFIDNDTMYGVVMEMDTVDADSSINYGIVGDNEAEDYYGFEDLYIREYKKDLQKKTNKDVTNYLNKKVIDALSLDEKALLLKLVQVKVDNSVYPAYITTNIRRGSKNIYDDKLCLEMMRGSYLVSNALHLIEKATVYLSNKYDISAFDEIIKTIHIKDVDDIIFIRDGDFLLRNMYSKLTSLNDWLFAFVLGPQNYSNKDYNNSALFTLYTKIAEAFVRLNIAPADYESNFNKIVGTLFKNDANETGILPYDSFKYFASAVTDLAQPIAEGDATVTNANIYAGDTQLTTADSLKWKYVNNILVLEYTVSSDDS